MSDADCTPGREPRSVAASLSWYFCCKLPSVLWHCWLSVTKIVRPAINWVMRCRRGYLSWPRCKWYASGPADATISHFVKIQIVVTFLVPAYPRNPGNEAIKWEFVSYFCCNCKWNRKRCSSRDNAGEGCRRRSMTHDGRHFSNWKLHTNCMKKNKITAGILW